MLQIVMGRLDFQKDIAPACPLNQTTMYFNKQPGIQVERGKLLAWAQRSPDLTLLHFCGAYQT